jgi:type IV secretion system protein VirB9
LPAAHAVRPGSGASPAQRGWVEPSPLSWVNARQVFLWSDGAIYHVYTQPGMITDIALQPGEALIAVAAGDTARWVIGDTTSGSGEDRRTHVLVKPFSAGLSTNLVITTDKRTYHLTLSSGPSGGMAALAWNYPLDELVAVKRAEAAAEAAKPVAAGLGIEQMYFGYQITGDQPTWRPLRAFDDGRQTFIEFPATIAVDEAPPLFLIGADGAAELVNYRMRGRFYVVDRIFDVAELRLGTRKQQVVRITRGGGKGRGRS